jgi:predicted amidohydrolase
MPAPLTLAVAQPPTVSFDVAANALAHAAAIRAAGARVVVFPELSLTGYELRADVVSTDDPRLAPIVEACRETGALALVGAPVAGEHIAMLAVGGDGARVAYRKRNLGAAEAERFTPGPGPVVLEVDGWRLGLAICKDTGVERHAADAAALGMHAYVAGAVNHAADADLQHERARRTAIRHGVWVAVASCAGATGEGYDPTAGRSGIYGPDGVAVAQAGTEPGEVVSATLS